GPGKAQHVTHPHCAAEWLFIPSGTLALETLLRQRGGRRRALYAMSREALTREEPQVRARAAANFQNAYGGAIGSTVEIARHKSNQILARVLAPILCAENPLPNRIPYHKAHLR